MDWKTTIPKCFGSDDLALGSHDLDAERVQIMISEARGTGSAVDDIRAAVQEYLESQQAEKDHIAAQMEKLEEYLAAV
jgi:hypothetical protein